MRSRLTSMLLFLCASTVGAQATWVVDSTPILDVPGIRTGGTVNFGYAAGGIRLADGGLLIADRAENSIRVFDASGRLVRSMGRTGDGPDEFRSMMWVGRCGGDSLMIWDLGKRRATMVGATTSSMRQFTVPMGDTAQPPFKFSCSSRGTMVYQSTPRPLRGARPNADNPFIMSVANAVYVVGPDGAVLRRLGDLPGGEVVPMTSPSGGRGAAPRPLGRASHVAAIGDAVAISSADSAFVSFVDATGKSTRHDVPVTLRAPTQAEFDAAIEALASMSPAANRQEAISQLAAIPMPARLPPISALYSDTEGLLWVQTTPPGGRALDFLVLQREGRLVARVRVPRGLTLFDIGRDYVVGSYTDSADEMHVAVFRLRRQ